MTFSNLPYKRPDIDALIANAYAIETKLVQEDNSEKIIDIIKTFFKLQDDIDMMAQLANIRYSLNTSDDFYEAERNFFDEQGPNVTEAIQKVIHTILKLDQREALETHFGALFF